MEFSLRKQVSMIRKDHNHTLQTNALNGDEEMHTITFHIVRPWLSILYTKGKRLDLFSNDNVFFSAN